MNKIKKNIIYIIIILLSNFTLVNSAENKILFKLNNNIITTVDLLNEIQFLSLINNEFANLNKDKKIEIAKNSQIRDKIKLIEISKYRNEFNLPDSTLDKLIKNYFTNLNINNLKDFDTFFKENNLDTDFIKMKIILDSMWKRLIYEKYSKNVKINQEEIETNLKKMKKQKEYLLSEIVFNLNENEKLESKVKLINKTVVNRSFSEAAFTFSISNSSKSGGKLGWVKESILSQLIKNELKSKKKNELTKAMVIPGGFLILYVEDMREIERKINVEDEIKNIINKKTNDQLDLYSNIYLNKIKKTIQINEF